MSIICGYENRYRNVSANLYPTEFLVRWFKGTYPEWKLDNISSPAKVLDLGFGDGRNIQFLLDEGLNVFGTEISDFIVDRACRRFSGKIPNQNLKRGFNGNLPFEDSYFDFLVSVHSLYYMEWAGSLKANLVEAARCIADGGWILASVPKTTSYLIANSQILDQNHAIVSDDPVGVRNGQKIAFIETKSEAQSMFSQYFDKIAIGDVDSNWWGIHEDYWIISGKKKGGSNWQF